MSTLTCCVLIGALQNLLQRDPRTRLKADEALRHPWLQLESVQHAADQPLGPSIVQRLQRFHTCAICSLLALVLPQQHSHTAPGLNL